MMSTGLKHLLAGAALTVAVALPVRAAHAANLLTSGDFCQR
jgi:hypothetical protein